MSQVHCSGIMHDELTVHSLAWSRSVEPELIFQAQAPAPGI